MDDQDPQLEQPVDQVFRDPEELPEDSGNPDALDRTERRCAALEISDVSDAEGLGQIRGREY